MTKDSFRNVLVADDEAVVAQAIAESIRLAFRCAVDVVHEGDSALEALASKPYDLLIADMVMPGLHGLDLVARVAQDWPSVDILVSTGFPAEFPYVEVIQAGASDFIVKPYPQAELEAKVLRLFTGRRLHETAPAPSAEDSQQERGAGTAKASGSPDARYRTAFELNVDGMLILTVNGLRISDANQAFCNAVARPYQDLLGASLVELFEERSRERVEQAFHIFAETRQGALSNVWIRRPDGASVCFDLRASFIQVGEDEFVQVSCRDATEQHRLHERLAEFAQRDPLTDLLNRRMLFMHLEGAIIDAKRTAQAATLLFIDLDHFKTCNDTFGHQQGDALLKAVADLIRKHTRVATDEGFRYGGDEFALLLRNADGETGARVGERIRLDYAQEDRFGTTMSVGVAQYDGEMDSAAFVRSADAALYNAKFAGRNQVFLG